MGWQKPKPWSFLGLPHNVPKGSEIHMAPWCLREPIWSWALLHGVVADRSCFSPHDPFCASLEAWALPGCPCPAHLDMTAQPSLFWSIPPSELTGSRTLVSHSGTFYVLLITSPPFIPSLREVLLLFCFFPSILIMLEFLCNPQGLLGFSFPPLRL